MNTERKLQVRHYALRERLLGLTPRSKRMLQVGVLASGSGTNLASLIEAIESGRVRARISVVVCNVPGALALHRSERRIPRQRLRHAQHAVERGS